MPLFHSTTHFEYGAGERVLPGNWGKIIFELGPSHNCWAREMALEAVRAWNFPQKPSRLKSAFACDNIITAIYFMRAFNPNGKLYEVRICDESAPTHKGNFIATQPLPELSDNMLEIANKYWNYSLRINKADWLGVECSEVLTTSSLKVIREIKSEEVEQNLSGFLQKTKTPSPTPPV